MTNSDRVQKQLDRLTDKDEYRQRLVAFAARLLDKTVFDIPEDMIRGQKQERERRILTCYDSEETRNPDGVAIARAFRAAYKSRP